MKKQVLALFLKGDLKRLFRPWGSLELFQDSLERRDCSLGGTNFCITTKISQNVWHIWESWGTSVFQLKLRESKDLYVGISIENIKS